MMEIFIYNNYILIFKDISRSVYQLTENHYFKFCKVIIDYHAKNFLEIILCFFHCVLIKCIMYLLHIWLYTYIFILFEYISE